MASYEYDSQNQKLNRIAGGTLFSEMPIGSEIEYAGTTAPTGFLKCDGSTYSQTTYPELYAILGTTTLPNKSGYIIKAKQIGVPADFVDAIEDVVDDKRHYYHTTFQGSTTNGWNYTDIAFDKTFKYPPLVSITIASVGYIGSAITYWQDTLSPFYAVEVDKMRIAYFVKDNTQITYDVNVIGELATN